MSRLLRPSLLLLISTIFASAAWSQTATPATTQPATSQSTTRQLTIADIFSEGGITGKMPDSLTWSPDSKHLTYLNEDGELMEIDPSTAGVTVLLTHQKIASLTAASGSEKDKDHRTRYGMASYIWAPDSKHLLFDSNGQLWLYDLRNGTGVQIAATGAASGDDPKFSPDGAYLSYIRDHNLQLHRLRDAGTPITNLTNTHEPTSLNGEVDWVYEEELDVRTNYAWSPDSKQIAYLHMNEAAVPEYPLVDWIPLHPVVDQQR